MIFQDPFSSLNPRMRVGNIIKEGLCFLKPELSEPETNNLVQEVIKSVGLDVNSLISILMSFLVVKGKE